MEAEATAAHEVAGETTGFMGSRVVNGGYRGYVMSDVQRACTRTGDVGWIGSPHTSVLLEVSSIGLPAHTIGPFVPALGSRI